MFTLEMLEKATGAKIKSDLLGNQVMAIKKARNMFFSGEVIYHLSMFVGKGSGLNGTDVWPAYLVNDNGTLKVVYA